MVASFICSKTKLQEYEADTKILIICLYFLIFQKYKIT